MQMKMLFHDIKKMVPLLVKHLFPPADAHHLAFDAQDRCPVGELDVEVVAGQGQDFFLEHERFGALGGELGEDADGGWDGCEVGHCCGEVRVRVLRLEVEMKMEMRMEVLFVVGIQRVVVTC